MLFSALNRNTEAGPLQGVVVPNLASLADREQEFEAGADIDSAADVCCADVSMYLRVSNPVLQYATSFVEPYPKPPDSHGDAGTSFAKRLCKKGVTNNVARLVMALICALHLMTRRGSERELQEQSSVSSG